MPKQVRFIATVAMDDFYQNYVVPTDYFTLEDFITRVGNAAADFYQKGWDRQYQELRTDKVSEVVSFDASFLSEQFVKVKKEGSEWIGLLEKQAVSFPYDMQNTGYQLVFDRKTGKELERSNAHETWNYQYQPFNNRLFFRIDRNQIKVFTKGNCNVQELRILYVPSIKIGDGDEELPDGIVGVVIATVVAYMRELAGRPVKKSLDQNQNIAMETEVNKSQLK